MDIHRIRSQIENHFKEKKEEKYKQQTNEHNRTFSKYYQDKRWKNLRESYYLSHPLCEIHEREGIVRPTEEIHHLIRFSSSLTEEGKYNLLLNPANLCACCRECHMLIHKIMRERHVDKLSIDEVINYKKEHNTDSVNYNINT